MLKKILIALGILIALSLTFFIASAIFLKIAPKSSSPKEERLLRFIERYPDKCAIKLVRNDTVLVSKNENKLMSLASTVKIIIAIEYAIQAANKTIDPDENISLNALNRFYVPKSDGGAHSRWLKSINRTSSLDSVSIREIAAGMIKYSSNANTEWLCEKLSLKKINDRLTKLGASDHTEIFYLVSALFITDEIFPNIDGKLLESKLTDMSIEQYTQASNLIHHKILADSTYIKRPRNTEMNIQKIRSERLPNSTAAEYIEIMKKINSRTYFSKAEQKYLDEIMEHLLGNPSNRKWLAHIGRKGGSTATIQTSALYARDQDGNTTELVYFFEDLSPIKNRRVEKLKNSFELNILNDKDFRAKVQKTLE